MIVGIDDLFTRESRVMPAAQIPLVKGDLDAATVAGFFEDFLEAIGDADCLELICQVGNHAAGALMMEMKLIVLVWCANRFGFFFGDIGEPLGNLALSTVFRPGVAALAKMLSDDWARDGIRVNHLIPGRVATDRLLQIDEDTARRQGSTQAEVRAGIEGGIPLGRYGETDEFAAAAVFLLSDAASYITGATLQVDGGMLRSLV